MQKRWVVLGFVAFLVVGTTFLVQARGEQKLQAQEKMLDEMSRDEEARRLQEVARSLASLERRLDRLDERFEKLDHDLKELKRKV
ncbi:MAG: hypothetical protein HYS55_03825 [Candidatus Omnitrophica bacterium]|nr:hypothetical protein [Candidatus Omnitrophota bacterium]